MTKAKFKALYKRDKYGPYMPQNYRQYAAEVAEVLIRLPLRTIHPWPRAWSLITENVNPNLPCTAVHTKRQILVAAPFLSYHARSDCAVEFIQLTGKYPQIIADAEQRCGVRIQGGVMVALNGYSLRTSVLKGKTEIKVDVLALARKMETKFSAVKFPAIQGAVNMFKAALIGQAATFDSMVDAGLKNIPDNGHQKRELIT